MVVVGNPSDEVCKIKFGAFEANFEIYHSAPMSIGEVKLNDDHGLCCIWIKNGFEDASEVGVRAFSFGKFHQWRVRSLLLLDPRFNGRDFLKLSSVRRTKDLQLSSFQP